MLAREDATEYRDLLGALVEEHQPAGATEAHLVEELAAIIWRKRRVLAAAIGLGGSNGPLCLSRATSSKCVIGLSRIRTEAGFRDQF